MDTRILDEVRTALSILKVCGVSTEDGQCKGVLTTDRTGYKIMVINLDLVSQ